MPIKSMTGYGAAPFSLGDDTLRLEIRAVNHRHLDQRIRLPQELSEMEPRIRDAIRERVRRGHLVVSVNREETAGGAKDVQVDLRFARRAFLALEELRGELGLAGGVTLGHLLSFEGVAQVKPRRFDAEETWAAVGGGLARALDDLESMRRAEGGRLEVDLRARIAATARLAVAIRDVVPQMLADQRLRLQQRLAELTAETNGDWRQDRLEAEIALFADRSDVAEELTRVEAHLAAMGELMARDEADPCGRKLEFLAIELNRELNTIGSKVSSAEIAHQVVEAKTEVERIREQVANVE